MFTDFFRLTDEDIDRCVDRVLSSHRVEKIALRISERILEHLADAQDEKGV